MLLEELKMGSQVRSTASCTLGKYSILTIVVIVLLVDPMKTMPDRAVRKVFISYKGDESLGEHAKCDLSHCPAIPPLSRLEREIKVQDRGESSRATR